jgi:hypothetical protein
MPPAHDWPSPPSGHDVGPLSSRTMLPLLTSFDAWPTQRGRRESPDTTLGRPPGSISVKPPGRQATAEQDPDPASLERQSAAPHPPDANNLPSSLSDAKHHAIKLFQFRMWRSPSAGLALAASLARP